MGHTHTIYYILNEHQGNFKTSGHTSTHSVSQESGNVIPCWAAPGKPHYAHVKNISVGKQRDSAFSEKEFQPHQPCERTSGMLRSPRTVCVQDLVFRFGYCNGAAQRGSDDNLPAMQETRVQSLVREDSLEKGMATHSRILAWGIPLAEEPGGLQAVGLQRVRHD